MFSRCDTKSQIPLSRTLVRCNEVHIEFGYPILSSEWTKQYFQKLYRSVITSLLSLLKENEWRGANKLYVDCKSMLTIIDYKLRTEWQVERHRQRNRHTDTMRCGLSWCKSEKLWVPYLVASKLRSPLLKRILLRNEDEFYDPEMDVLRPLETTVVIEGHSATIHLSRTIKNNLVSTVLDSRLPLQCKWDIWSSWALLRGAGSYRCFRTTYLSLEDGTVRFSRNIGNYQKTPHNIPEERSSNLQRGGSLKSRN